ncbi:MAG: PqiC family protein [Candidatus Binatia bacterium]|nr:PqiC family protein [Candidatus Binatia bacterium]
MTRSCRLSLLSAVALALACSSPTSRFYTLAPTVPADLSAHAALAIGVGPVEIPSAVDRPQFVLQVAPNRVTLHEYHRWAAPLGEAIAQTVAADLSALLGTPDVVPLPAPGFRYDLRVTLDVQRFESVPDQRVEIDAVWSVHDSADPAGMRSGRTVAQEPVEGRDVEALAAAHSRALGQLSRRIAQAIQAEMPSRESPKK